MSFKKQSESSIEPALQIALDMFHRLEAAFNKALSNYCEHDDFVKLSKAITLAEEVIQLMNKYQLGNQGILLSQSSLYLAHLLEKRATCYFNLAVVFNVNPEENRRLAQKDCYAAIKIAEKWDLPTTGSKVILNNLS